MTDGYNQPPSQDPGDPGREPGPGGAFAVPPSGGASWLPSDEPVRPTPDEPGRTAGGEPTWPGAGGASPTGETTPAGAPAGWAPHAGEPTWPGSGWSPRGGEPTWPGAGWQAQPGGWQAQPGGWHPPGSGWVPPGAGWAAAGGAWGPPPVPAPSEPRRSRFIAFAVVAAVVVLALGTGLGYLVRGPSTSDTVSLSPSSGSGSSGLPSTSGSTSGSGSSGSGSSSSSSGSPSDIASIAAGVDPDLVDINTTLKDENEQAAGTGMVLTSSGVVLTNNHVIEGATTITATDIGNGKSYSASVIGYDRTDDVAVIQLKNASGLKTVSIGNSSNAATGEGVVGIGNAGGVGGTPSTAGGSITALDQSITASDEGGGSSEKLSGLIETNCDIEPGDSGGPLVTTSGQVIGMDTAASESSGGAGAFSYQTTQTSAASSGDQGYSIPINEAMTLAKKIEAGSGSSTIHIGTTAFLGVEVLPTGATTAGTTGFGGFGTTGFSTRASSGTGTSSTGTSSTAGAHITTVLPGEPAEKAGLAGGDVITTFGGKAITSATSLTSVINGYHPGDKVKVTWVNTSAQQQSATVTLANGPAA